MLERILVTPSLEKLHLKKYMKLRFVKICCSTLQLISLAFFLGNSETEELDIYAPNFLTLQPCSFG